MIAGTVTIDPSTGAVSTATGMAASIFLADIDSMPPEWMPSYTLGQTTAPFTPARPANQHDVDAGFSATVAMLTETARKATAYAAGIVGYIQANAKAEYLASTVEAVKLYASAMADLDNMGEISELTDELLTNFVAGDTRILDAAE